MKKILFSSFMLLTILLVFFGYPKYQLHFSTVTIDSDNLEIFISSNSQLSDVSNTLVKNNIFVNQAEFEKYSIAFDYNENNLEPGKYRFDNGQKLKHVIYGLKNGNQEIKDSKIVFTYSQNIPSMISKIHHSIEADSADLVNYILSDSVIAKYGFNTETIISLFLPDTYEVGEWDMDKIEFVAFMANQYKAFWTEKRQAKAKNLNLAQSQVSTLASIVMSEQSKLEDEWPIIAGLYLNRLKKGIKLESDPTFKFCWGDELKNVQRLLYKHRDKDCPYNTYIYSGLPPGPIMLVSKKAIDAVLNPEKTDYIFMCAIGDGTGKHNFANSYVKHLKNASIYKRNQFGTKK